MPLLLLPVIAECCVYYRYHKTPWFTSPTFSFLWSNYAPYSRLPFIWIVSITARCFNAPTASFATFFQHIWLFANCIKQIWMRKRFPNRHNFAVHWVFSGILLTAKQNLVSCIRIQNTNWMFLYSRNKNTRDSKSEEKKIKEGKKRT